MEIENVPFRTIDWTAVPRVEHKGETGTSFWRTVETGNLRVRIVEYSPGFRSDHYCSRGHVVFVLEGEHRIRLKDGKEYIIKQGMSYQTADNERNPHQACSITGGRALIVD